MNRPMRPLAIKASGMVTPVGFNYEASCAAMRAGIDGLNEANLWDTESGTYLNAGKVHLPHWWTGLGKLAEIVAPAIQECLEAAQPITAGQIPLLLCVAGLDRPFRWQGLEGRILNEVEFKLGLKFHVTSRVIPNGRVSGVLGIQMAQQLIERRQASCCIIAGVDSFVDQKVVEAYLEKRRILTPIHSNGFLPGEAGCALLVSPSQELSRGRLGILGIGMAKEDNTIESEAPLRGDGLAQAVRIALSQAGLTISDMAYRITDLNGEHYKFKEASIVVTRLMHQRKGELFDLWHPIEFLGDIGAAIVPCTISIALHAHQRGYSPGPYCLFHFSNDDGERAALIVGMDSGEGS